MNFEERHLDVCHSHDFCDSNIAMDEAFQKTMGREYVFNDEENPETRQKNYEDELLINTAWGIAKSMGFSMKNNFTEGLDEYRKKVLYHIHLFDKFKVEFAEGEGPQLMTDPQDPDAQNAIVLEITNEHVRYEGQYADGELKLDELIIDDLVNIADNLKTWLLKNESDEKPNA